MNVAVILSAGTGSRFGADIPKQFINLAGKNIIEYTITQFQYNQNIDEICIVANKEYHGKLFVICKENDFSKVRHIINGGKERYDSSYEAIRLYQQKNDVNLIFHDAVRPFISNEIITNTIKALEKYSAIDVAIPTADTIIKVDKKNNVIDSIPVREFLRRGQTPQAFKLSIIKKAHELARQSKEPLLFTDDCGLVKSFLPEIDIFVVEGEERNIKITYPEDLLFAEKLIQLETITNSSKNLDFTKLKDKVVVIFGGNSGIGLELSNICKEFCNVYSLSRKNGIDIQNLQDVKAALERVYLENKRIDYVINCVGYLEKKELSKMNNNDITTQININFTGAVNIANASFNYLKESKGMLLQFTSSSYTRGRELYSLYSATKAAIVNFTQAIAQEWKNDGIKVNAINPARTKTKMRVDNFGIEPEETLLSVNDVALSTINTMIEEYSGLVIDIKKGI
ncbi:bifunctional cytidylyltransferase/SDR family oxidoreductase [Arcobacter sp. F2176]|uniref:bifunctional cytidylyltransferase/SDR family oxidoreductase n=1 Tax=Arcobacter sp. F2176 TaxID=2044511 RepID=UPI00100B52DC|nr:bifunctional cytidylyltransferase/SDR family oxidoreductase [Arcobacter sp. F2176]RXJ81107.1 2-C-methyl-D-erythritol 4-phosphate cytidylyltransferase [Arcobacter sp. F2176]